VAAKSLAHGWYIHGFLSAESTDGFMGVFDAKSHGGATGPAVGLEWASFHLGPSGSAEPVAAPDPTA
jgi:hypothetical protein